MSSQFKNKLPFSQGKVFNSVTKNDFVHYQSVASQQCWPNVRPPSTTLAQHQLDIRFLQSTVTRRPNSLRLRHIRRARILVQVTIYRRFLIGRDGHLDQSEAYDIS